MNSFETVVLEISSPYNHSSLCLEKSISPARNLGYQLKCIYARLCKIYTVTGERFSQKQCVVTGEARSQ